MADPNVKIELGSFVPHFIIYVLWKLLDTGEGRRGGEKKRKACKEDERDWLTVERQSFDRRHIQNLDVAFSCDFE